MKIFIRKPYFLLLLPVFFILHSLAENFAPVLLKTAILQVFFYSGIALALAVLFFLFLKNILKAALAAFFILSCNFFFGSFYDFLKTQFGHSLLTKFSVLIPAMLLAIFLMTIYLKKSNRSFIRTARYLNLLLFLLILIDAGALAFKLINGKETSVTNLSGDLINCDTCAKPDIYLIIADEYAGNTELKDLFSFDNSVFENELKTRGFHIVNNSKSNYNATVYSMASLLNMDYIKNLVKPGVINHQDMLRSRGLIRKNNLVTFLTKNGYGIRNYSFFDLAAKKKIVRNYFYPTNQSLLTYQTFVNRFIYHFGARFASTQKIENFKKNDLYNNIKIDSLTRNIVSGNDTGPKFIYSHFNMPHHPYFFDSNGAEVPADKLTDEFALDKKAYINYLKYTNKKLLDLVDFIIKNSSRPVVISLLGDHGFRQLTNNAEPKYHFMTLNAIYFPNGNYSGFYDGMSNVNQFRVTLNSIFGQQLPLLKDSTSFLIE
jgi:hypothetical protein